MFSSVDAEKLRSLQISPEAKTRSQWPAWAILSFVLLCCGLAAYYAWPRKSDARRVSTASGRKAAGSQSSSNATPAPLPAAPSMPPATGSVLTVSGYIVNRERIEVSPRFLGQVKWIGVRKGDLVTNGQVLVLLDDAEQKARVKQAEGRLAEARAAVAKAELTYQRVIRLIADRIETQEREDDTRLQLESAGAVFREAEAALEVHRTYLDWTVIRSTLDGVILEKLVDVGELVTPQSFGGTRGPSTALLAIADPKDLQVEIDLNENDLAKVSRQQRCRISPEAYPDRVYQGYVAEVAPEANRQKGTLQVKVQILNPDRYLTPELSAKVDFLAGE